MHTMDIESPLFCSDVFSCVVENFAQCKINPYSVLQIIKCNTKQSFFADYEQMLRNNELYLHRLTAKNA